MPKLLDWLKTYAARYSGQLALVSPWLKNVIWTISRAFLALAREGYAQNSVVYACLRLLGHSTPEPPLVAHVQANDRTRQPLPWDHPLQQLIEHPNPWMTQYEMVELITLHLGIGGKSHWWKRRDNGGQVAQLWPLRPDRVGPIYASAAANDEGLTGYAGLSTDDPVLAGWTYLPPGMGAAIALPARDVMTLNFPDPAGESGGIVEGLGPLQVLAREVEADNEATTFVGTLLKNHAQPGIILKVRQGGVAADSAAKVKRRFMAQFGGVKRGEPAVVDADTDVIPSGFDLGQLEFPNLRRIAESRISAAFGVPAILVGLDAGLQSGIRATIQDQRRYFTETTLTNYWRRIESQFTADVASEFGANLVCAFDLTKVKALTEQSRFELEPIKEGYGLGAVTVDEYRDAVLHLPPLPNGQGNVLLIPATASVVDARHLLTSAELAMAGAALALQPQTDAGAAGGDTGDAGPPGDGADAADEADMGAGGKSWDLADDFTWILNESIGDLAAAFAKGALGRPHPHRGHRGPHPGARGKPHPHHGSHGPHPHRGSHKPRPGARHAHKTVAGASHTARVTAGLDGSQVRLETYLQGLLARIQSELSSLPKSAKATAFYGPSPADTEQLTHILRDTYATTTQRAYGDAGRLLGVDVPLDLKSGPAAAVQAVVPGRVDLINVTTTRMVTDAVMAGTAQGEDIAGITKRLQASPAFAASRAQTIGRTESANASNLATVAAYRDSGLVDSVEVMDGDGDPGCADANGAIWSLDHADANPLEHPNCRRAFSPVLSRPDDVGN